jgi:hypothetical protein
MVVVYRNKIASLGVRALCQWSSQECELVLRPEWRKRIQNTISTQVANLQIK